MNAVKHHITLLELPQFESFFSKRSLLVGRDHLERPFFIWEPGTNKHKQQNERQKMNEKNYEKTNKGLCPETEERRPDG